LLKFLKCEHMSAVQAGVTASVLLKIAVRSD
jgi:hypothetical protein